MRPRTILGGLILGAGAAYLLSPREGRRRRAQLRDRATAASRRVGQFFDGPVTNRARDTRDTEDGANGILAERVRARLGRFVGQPAGIGVTAADGFVRLDGDVLESEHAPLLDAIRSVRGVQDIDDRLNAHRVADGVPGLQSTAGRGMHQRRLSGTWSPAMRVVAGATGGGLLLYGIARRPRYAPLVNAAGLALLARASDNDRFHRLIGVNTGRRNIILDKSLVVDAPPERVYEAWSNIRNFPRFMSHVREVRDLGDGRLHWVVDGPAGLPVSWNAVVTRREQPSAVAWKSVKSPVRNAGILHFEPVDNGRKTRVRMRLSYNPPAGLLGHFVATLTGANPDRELDDDLARFKAVTEQNEGTVRDVTGRARRVSDTGAGL